MALCVADFPEQKDRLEGKLQGTCTWCMYNCVLVLVLVCALYTELLVKDLNLLEKHSLITMEDGFTLQPTGIHVHPPPSSQR